MRRVVSPLIRVLPKVDQRHLAHKDAALLEQSARRSESRNHVVTVEMLQHVRHQNHLEAVGLTYCSEIDRAWESTSYNPHIQIAREDICSRDIWLEREPPHRRRQPAERAEADSTGPWTNVQEGTSQL
jgi:hypothetical protein